MEASDEVFAQVSVLHGLLEHMVKNDQKAMVHGDHGSLLAPARCQALRLGG
jgi:hypothetical protein